MEITLHNRQRKVAFSLPRLRRLAAIALGECARCCPGNERAVLHELPGVEVSFVSDRTIAGVHRRFMNIPGATDVITFDHGEIVIGVGTARENAAAYGRGLDEELALYIVHGLLHLNGYGDQIPAEAELMHRVQEQILATCLAEAAGEEAA